jgi:hypothetical protein
VYAASSVFLVIVYTYWSGAIHGTLPMR